MTAPAARGGWDACALLALLLAAILAALTFADYGVTWDEPGLRTYGRMLVDWYASGFADGRAFAFANLRYYGGGFDILATLGWFVATALVGMLLQLFGVYSLVVWLIGGRKPLQFFRDISEAMLTAFSTSSSNATLPTSLRVAQERLRLPKEISQFVLTIGSTGNQNGTALYEGVVVLFLAQVFGVELSFGQQVTVVLMSILAGVGTAGVPGGSIPLICVVLDTVGVPPEGIALILGIDRILDMCRTVLNVAGDLVLATCVAGKDQTAATPAPI